MEDWPYLSVCLSGRSQERPRPAGSHPITRRTVSEHRQERGGYPGLACGAMDLACDASNPLPKWAAVQVAMLKSVADATSLSHLYSTAEWF